MTIAALLLILLTFCLFNKKKTQINVKKYFYSKPQHKKYRFCQAWNLIVKLKTIDQSVAADRRNIVTLQKCHTCVTSKEIVLNICWPVITASKGKKMHISFPRRNISWTVIPRYWRYINNKISVFVDFGTFASNEIKWKHKKISEIGDIDTRVQLATDNIL